MNYGHLPGTPTSTREAVTAYYDALHAAECAKDLADYLGRVRPDLEESILSLRGLETAIRRTMVEAEKP